MTKLAAGSLLTTEDQKRLYAEVMGADALARQARLANLSAGRCSCTPSSLKRRWESNEKATTRRVHQPTCPKWKPWMEEART